MTRQTQNLSANLVRFFHYLRASGLNLTVSEDLDAIKGVSLIDIFHKPTFYYVLRTSLVKSAEQYALFDALFDQFWIDHTIDEPTNFKSSETPSDSFPHRLVIMPDRFEQERDSSEPGNVEEFSLYSPVETLSRQAFTSPTLSELHETELLLKKLNRRLATRSGRRHLVSSRGDTNLKGTIRESLRNAGDILKDFKTRRKESKSKITLLCDISGSMQAQSDHILRVMYLLPNVIRGSEVFAFSTNLIRFTDLIRRGEYSYITNQIGRLAPIWGSGTRIGDSFSKFIKHYSVLLDMKTWVVVISDGWDLGEPDALCKSIAQIRRRCKGIAWLNPLFGHSDYEPTCVGMKNALPYVDLFSSSDALKSRRLFERYLGRSIGPN